MELYPRTSQQTRKTRETEITLTLNLDGSGVADIHTGIGFFDHMLTLFAAHGRFDLTLHARGDLHVDDHHTVEDVGITLGTAFRKALGDKRHIQRYGHAYVPMDEALARAVVDLSGRFYLRFEATFARSSIGPFATEMVDHFWYSFAEHAAINLHISLLYGQNTHHGIEAIFKATARALHLATRRDLQQQEVPSTKGVL